MTVGFAVASLGADPTSSDVVATARLLDVRAISLERPPPAPAEWRAALRAHAIEVAAVDAEPESLGAAVGVAARFRARAVRVDAGLRERDREAHAERLVRALHRLVREGAPAALRLGRGPDDLVDAEVLGWVRSELPEVVVWFDPWRAARLAEAGLAPPLLTYAADLAPHCAGVTVAGPGPEGRGGGHPEDGGPDWSTLVSALPRRAAWIVELDPALGRDALEDAVRVTRSWFVR